MNFSFPVCYVQKDEQESGALSILEERQNLRYYQCYFDCKFDVALFFDFLNFSCDLTQLFLLQVVIYVIVSITCGGLAWQKCVGN